MGNIALGFGGFCRTIAKVEKRLSCPEEKFRDRIKLCSNLFLMFSGIPLDIYYFYSEEVSYANI